MHIWLLDTGPIVAFLDPRDREHEFVSSALETFSGRFVTTSAVIVEAMHLLGGTRSGPTLLVALLLESQTEIHDCTSPNDLTDAAELLAKYADVPMDFADASLVLLGRKLRVNEICTLDRRGFRTYRTATRRAFTLVLDD